jgi:hypothetical protein
MKFKSIKYKKGQGPKQDWDCNFIQRTMIGDESGLREAVLIKEQQLLRLQMSSVKKGSMAMK